MHFQWNYAGHPNVSLHDPTRSDYVLGAFLIARHDRARLARPCCDFAFCTYEFVRWEAGRWLNAHNAEQSQPMAWSYIPWPNPQACDVPNMTALGWPYQAEYAERCKVQCDIQEANVRTQGSERSGDTLQ